MKARVSAARCLAIPVMFFSCGCTAVNSLCENEYRDSSWESMDGRDFYAELSEFNESAMQLEDSLKIFGPPRIDSDGGATGDLNWIRGVRRSNRTYRCGKLTEEIFHVTYAVIAIHFDEAGASTSCAVSLRNYIGDNRAPDMASQRPIHEESKSCDAFVRQAETSAE